MPDGWDGALRKVDTWQDRSGFAGRPLRDVPIIGRNGAGQQARTAMQCCSLSLIDIKRHTAKGVYS
ncbi:hypothetical protein EAS61_13535 [Bradyrhizobium zhanjiangense]|uniref:Uncharacterized protein n=1 Tax=Bradyrhizobium zhanjiangense TaxID=1325107 RepID=A0A4Q0QQC9_9BRAD|nr:hypothetical protein EAS61_13535 [Bradyrhizobium zhanjiangense]